MGKLRYRLQLSLCFYVASSTHVYVFPKIVLGLYFSQVHFSVDSCSIDSFLGTDTTGLGICQEDTIGYIIHYTLSILMSICAKTF